MRIFYAAESSPNVDFKSQIWRNNLYCTLKDMGHEVIEFKSLYPETFKYRDAHNASQKEFIEKNRPLFSQDLLEQIKKEHLLKPIDLFFSYFYDAFVLPETIDQIKALGIKTANWYCNGSYQLQLVSNISRHYDWCLVPEKFRLTDYKAMGANPIYCQEAANPNIYKHYQLPYEFDVTFVGQAYGERPAYIHYLLEQGIAVRVWGSRWENFCNINRSHTNFSDYVKKLSLKNVWRVSKKILKEMMEKEPSDLSIVHKDVSLPSNIMGPVLSDENMIKMYSRSKINLGFSVCGNTHKTDQTILQIRLRDFEVPMSGGFYMVAYMPELEEFYEIGKEIVCYEGPKDMAEKIKYYLEHDAEREKIRRAGYERCQKDHTWKKRFEISFKQMGFTD